MKTHLDLFSGYGGFSLACQIYGYKTINFSEIEKHAKAVIKYRFPEVENLGDVSKIDTKKLPHIDLITGGSPCQNLSISGDRSGLDGEKSRLFFHFVRIIKEVQPCHFIWENVKGALSSNKGWDFARVQIELAEAGYDLRWIVLNAKDYGVPQNRERIFAIGFRDKCPREVLRIAQDSGKALEELTSSQAHRVYKPECTSAGLASQAGGLGAKTGLYLVNDPSRKKGLEYSENIGTLRKETHGNLPSFIDLSTKDAKLTENARAIQSRYNKGYSTRSGEVSGVVTSENTRIRRLMPIECERLMGIPDDWTKYGDYDGEIKEIADTNRYKLCGNGVVPNCICPVLELTRGVDSHVRVKVQRCESCNV